MARGGSSPLRRTRKARVHRAFRVLGGGAAGGHEARGNRRGNKPRGDRSRGGGRRGRGARARFRGQRSLSGTHSFLSVSVVDLAGRSRGAAMQDLLRPAEVSSFHFVALHRVLLARTETVG